MADHALPTTTSTYIDVISKIDDRLKDLTLFLDPANTTPTGLITNAVRWNSASYKWQKWDGTAWVDPTTGNRYDININGTVGATTPTTGAFTSISVSGNSSFNTLSSSGIASLGAGSTVGTVAIADISSSQTLTNKTLGTGSTWSGNTIGVTSGGTGAADAATARTNLGVPSTTGGGASGTWGINISGNAATATSAAGLSSVLPIASGGTGQFTALNAFSAIKQSATETTTGVVELATTAETQTGTDTTRAVTPAGFNGSSLGWGQTWQNVTGSRTLGTTYYNTTGKPITISVTGSNVGSNFSLELTVGGLLLQRTNGTVAGNLLAVFGLIPPGGSYSVTWANFTPSWFELR